MVFSDSTIRSVLIIVNCFNIICALIQIGVTIFNYKYEQNVDSMFMNYFHMVMSAICCTTAFVGHSSSLEITANIFVSEIVATMVIWIYVRSFCTYTLIAMILHGIIASIAYVLIHRLRNAQLLETISSQLTPVMAPLNPRSSCL